MDTVESIQRLPSTSHPSLISKFLEPNQFQKYPWAILLKGSVGTASNLFATAGSLPRHHRRLDAAGVRGS